MAAPDYSHFASTKNKIRIGIFILFALIVLKFLFTPPDRYEPPINGQYNSPANMNYERDRARQEARDSRDIAREAGENAGRTYKDLKGVATEFGQGLKDGAGR